MSCLSVRGTKQGDNRMTAFCHLAQMIHIIIYSISCNPNRSRLGDTCVTQNSEWVHLGESHWITMELSDWGNILFSDFTLTVRVRRPYLMNNELVSAIWKSPAILLHQRNKGVAKQFLLSFVFSC